MESTHRYAVQLPCKTAVPMAFAATGQCAAPEITPVHVEADWQELVVTIPVLVHVEADAGDCRVAKEELVLATVQLRIESAHNVAAEFTVVQRLQVELPLTLDARADSALAVIGEWSDLQ